MFHPPDSATDHAAADRRRAGSLARRAGLLANAAAVVAATIAAN
jgi:hypothetical protein